MLKNVRILCIGCRLKKSLPWRVTGASVARHVERPWVRSKNVYIAEPSGASTDVLRDWRPAPRDRRGNEPPTRARARATGPLFVEFPGFSPRPEPSVEPMCPIAQADRHDGQGLVDEV